MFLFSIFGFSFSYSSLGYLFVSENFQRTMFQWGMVTIILSVLLFVLISLYSQGLQTGGVHYVYNRRVELKMQTIHNPFWFEVNVNRASYSGVECTFYGDKDYYLLGLWGVSIYHLFRLLNLNPHTLQNAITTSLDDETFSNICKSTCHLVSVKGGEKRTMIFKPEIGYASESLLKPQETILRSTYPFVALMIFKECDNLEDNFIAMATAVHLPDENLKLPAHVINQHAKPLSGALCLIRKIFLSSPETLGTDGENVNLCLACCTKAVSAVVLPCCHASVCTTCLEKCKNCPVCRGSAYSYFELQNVSAH